MKTGRSFWKWLLLALRASALKDARSKRIMQENLETWNRYNREFIKKCEREEDRKIDKMLEGYSSTSRHVDESSTVGCFGGDCGDGSAI